MSMKGVGQLVADFTALRIRFQEEEGIGSVESHRIYSDLDQDAAVEAPSKADELHEAIGKREAAIDMIDRELAAYQRLPQNEKLLSHQVLDEIQSTQNVAIELLEKFKRIDEYEDAKKPSEEDRAQVEKLEAAIDKELVGLQDLLKNKKLSDKQAKKEEPSSLDKVRKAQQVMEEVLKKLGCAGQSNPDGTTGSGFRGEQQRAWQAREAASQAFYDAKKRRGQLGRRGGVRKVELNQTLPGLKQTRSKTDNVYRKAVKQRKACVTELKQITTQISQIISEQKTVQTNDAKTTAVIKERVKTLEQSYGKFEQELKNLRQQLASGLTSSSTDMEAVD